MEDLKDKTEKQATTVIDDIDFSGLLEKQQKANKEEEEIPEGKSEEKPEEKIEEKLEEKSEEKPEEKIEEDFFTEQEEKKEEKKEEISFDFKSIIEESGLDIESEEVKTKEEFVQKIKETIDKAKKEVDLSKFDPQAQKLISHLNEGNLSLEEFFNNSVISSMNNIIGMNAESKFRTVRYQELFAETKDEDKALEALEVEIEDMSKGELKSRAEEIDQQAIELRKKEIEKIVQISEEKKAKSVQDFSQQEKKGKENLINYISKQDDFFGLKLSESAKRSIIRDIDTGNFNEVVNSNPEAMKFYAYMIGKFGKKISEKMNESIKEASREAYNKAQDASFKALHETEDPKKVISGHQSRSENAKKGFENWADSTLFGG